MLANILLTVVSGIRRGATAKQIAWEVTENLSIFFVIAAAVSTGGAVMIVAGAALAAMTALGTYQLVVAWPEMDNTDRTIALALVATYLAFGTALRPAGGAAPSALEARAAAEPAYPKIVVDMALAPGKVKTQTDRFFVTNTAQPTVLQRVVLVRRCSRNGSRIRSKVILDSWNP